MQRGEKRKENTIEKWFSQQLKGWKLENVTARKTIFFIFQLGRDYCVKLIAWQGVMLMVWDIAGLLSLYVVFDDSNELVISGDDKIYNIIVQDRA